MVKCGACRWWNGLGCMNWNQTGHGKNIHDTCDFGVLIKGLSRKKRRMKKGFPPGFGTDAHSQMEKQRERAERFHSRANKERENASEFTWHQRFSEAEFETYFNKRGKV